MAFCTEIICDACGDCITKSKIYKKGKMIHIARKAGWSFGKYCLCPECKNNRKQLIQEGWLN